VEFEYECKLCGAIVKLADLDKHLEEEHWLSADVKAAPKSEFYKLHLEGDCYAIAADSLPKINGSVA